MTSVLDISDHTCDNDHILYANSTYIYTFYSFEEGTHYNYHMLLHCAIRVNKYEDEEDHFDCDTCRYLQMKINP